MNRKYEIITSILVVIVIIGALIFAGKRGVLKEHSNIFNWNNKENYNDDESIKEFIPSDGIVNFNLDLPNTSLEIMSTQEKSVKVECISYGKNKYYINQNGDNVVVKKKKRFSIFNKDKGKVKILVPEEVLSTYDAEMSNGSVKISNINIQDIDVEASNGNVNIENLNVKNDIQIDSSNGKINAKNLVANDIEFDSSNGEIVLENVKGNYINIDTSNARISVNECIGDKIELDTSNAQIKAIECYAKEVILDTSNGDVTLENLKDKAFIIDKLKVDTSNGEKNINANYNSLK